MTYIEERKSIASYESQDESAQYDAVNLGA